MARQYPSVRLGSLLSQVTRRVPVKSDKEYDLLGTRWYARGLFAKSTKQGASIRARCLYEVRKGDFVYNRLFGWKGAFALAASEHNLCYVSNEFPCFAVDNNILDSKYLMYYFSMEHVWNEALRRSRGSTPTSRKRLSEEDFLSISIPLPPIQLQSEIASVLDTVVNNLIVTQGILLRSEQLRSGLMQQLLTRGIGHTEFKEIQLDRKAVRIPRSWTIRKLGDIARIKRGASPRPIGDPKYFGGNVGWVRISDLGASGKYLLETKQYLSELGVERSVRVFPGEVVMSICATVGKPCIVNTDACIHDGIVAFKELNNTVDEEFLYYMLLGMQERMKSKGQRGTQSNINAGIVKRTEISLPPLSEQKRIAKILFTVDEKLLLERQCNIILERLKRGLTQVLLFGEVRVKE